MTNVVAMPAPSANVSASASPAVTTSLIVKTASVVTDSSIQASEAIANRRRSTMSATEPVTSASSTAGTLFAVWTSAISVGEWDSAAITVTAPTVFIQMTSCDPASALHAARKPGRRSGASADSSVTGSDCAANECIMLVDGLYELASGRRRDAAGCRARGRRPPGHRIEGPERRDARARERGDRQAGAEGSRGPWLPPEPDRPQPQDEPVLHDRRADPGSHESALPSDPARHRGPARDGGVHAADGEHRQRSRARAARLADDACEAGRRNHRRDRSPRPPPARRAPRGGDRARARESPPARATGELRDR